jgi:hypothetical protein
MFKFRCRCGSKKSARSFAVLRTTVVTQEDRAAQDDEAAQTDGGA